MITFFIFFALRNLEKVSLLLSTGEVDRSLSPTFDFLNHSSVAVKDYNAWFNQYGNSFPGNITECDLEKEMQKVSHVLLLYVELTLYSSLMLMLFRLFRVQRAQA